MSELVHPFSMESCTIHRLNQSLGRHYSLISDISVVPGSPMQIRKGEPGTRKLRVLRTQSSVSVSGKKNNELLHSLQLEGLFICKLEVGQSSWRNVKTNL